ncbi:MAG: SgcJ/EcaC family oxidoreductase [Thermoplasmata archaeon]|jgi:uncharacterized protein (TIGR02246 family)
MPEDPEIPRLVLKLTAAMEHHDARALAALFTTDADFTDVAGATAHGQDAIQRYHAPLFDGPLRNSRYSAGLVAVRMLTDDLTAVDVGWMMSGALDGSGAERPTRRGQMNWILRKHAGGWQILILHNTEFASPRVTITERVRRGARSGLRAVRPKSSGNRSEVV